MKEDGPQAKPPRDLTTPGASSFEETPSARSGGSVALAAARLLDGRNLCFVLAGVDCDLAKGAG
jgi:hypothetical protein